MLGDDATWHWMAKMLAKDDEVPWLNRHPCYSLFVSFHFPLLLLRYLNSMIDGMRR